MNTTCLLITLLLQAIGTPQDAKSGFAPMLESLGEAGPDWWWRSPKAVERGRRLLTGTSIPEGWKVVGGPADYSIDRIDGELVLHGSGTADRNAFLIDPTILGDFILRCEVLIERDGGNSGIQIRSRVEGDRMIGYQIEIDPSPRAWSGGLYDESRRGWLSSLADNLDGRAAFVPGKWNRYEVLAVGPRIRTWVNGVPTVDHIDFVDDRGMIGFQVHSGDCDVSWRRLELVDLGIRQPEVVLSRDVGGDPTQTMMVEGGAIPDQGGYIVGTEGIDLTLPTPLPDGPSGLAIEATVTIGSLRIELGEAEIGPGYRLTVPAPLGDADGPGRIFVWRWRDLIRVFVDDVPLEPGPPDIDGPLPIRIRAEPGVGATIHRIVENPPTTVEREIINGSGSTDE